MSILGALGGIGKGVSMGAEEIRRQDEANLRKELAEQQKQDRAQQKASDAAYTEAQSAVGSSALNVAAPEYAAADTAVQGLAAQAPYGANGVAFDPANPGHAEYAGKLTDASKALPTQPAVTRADAERSFASNPLATAKDARASTNRAYTLDAADAEVIARKVKAGNEAIQRGLLKLGQLADAGMLQPAEGVKQMQGLLASVNGPGSISVTADKNGVASINYMLDGKVIKAMPYTQESMRGLVAHALDNSSMEMYANAQERNYKEAKLKEDSEYRKAVLQQTGAYQNASLAQNDRHFNAGTTSGKLQQIETTLGRPLTEEERLNSLGMSKMSQSTKIQVESLVKQQEVDSKAIADAQAKDLWVPDSLNARAFGERSAARQLQLKRLLSAQQGGNPAATSDPYGINAKPPSRGATPATWNGINADNVSGQAARYTSQLQVLQTELQRAKYPEQRDAIQRDIARAQKALNAIPANKSAPAQATAEPKQRLLEAGGTRVTARNDRIEKMNTLSGATSRRSDIVAQRSDDVEKNFDAQLAVIKPGISRADAVKTLEWFDGNSDVLSNEQRKQLRQARIRASL